MKEILHPPFNANFRPDLGGTSYDFVKQIGRDKITLYHRIGERLTTVEIPGPESFLKVALSDGLSGEFFEAYYHFTGELAGARLHFRRYCEQTGFMENARPDNDVLDAYQLMLDKGEDIMFDADMDEGKLVVSHGKYLPSGKFEVFTAAISDFPQSGAAIFETEPSETDDFLPVDFAITYKDNILSLGVVTNEDNAAEDSISDFASSKELNIRSTPADLVKFLGKVFIKV